MGDYNSSEFLLKLAAHLSLLPQTYRKSKLEFVIHTCTLTSNNIYTLWEYSGPSGNLSWSLGSSSLIGPGMSTGAELLTILQIVDWYGIVNLLSLLSCLILKWIQASSVFIVIKANEISNMGMKIVLFHSAGMGVSGAKPACWCVSFNFLLYFAISSTFSFWIADPTLFICFCSPDGVVLFIDESSLCTSAVPMLVLSKPRARLWFRSAHLHPLSPCETLRNSFLLLETNMHVLHLILK